MKRLAFIITICLVLSSCGRKTFQGFYNAHKAEIGTTSFQVPNFMKAALSLISPEVKQVVQNISDFKYIKFDNTTSFKRNALIEEMNAITNKGYTDMFRDNQLKKTRIISVKEKGNAVTDAIIFNSTKEGTTAYYMKGLFDPERIKSFSDEATFNKFSQELLQSYKTNMNPSFNPNH